MRIFSLIIAFVFTISKLSAQEEYKKLPFWDPKLPMEKRVNDLVSRLILEEKVAQMLNATPAIPRLGIPAYEWWNEILHGVARTPYNVTSYPQAIAMAATWDTNSLYRMADYSALEGRAIHNKAIALGRTGDRYLGLTYWTPNINIFRDPRWGRGQETYGEDPFLTAMLAKSFVRGLQGEDPKYLKAAACAKHFAVHSGPEPTRHADNFNPSAYDLWDTYLPAFRELVVKAKVAGVMCAYNAVNTQPCCASDLLMVDILRNQWKFTGYVTSDCGAIDDFFNFHKTHPDAVAASADAVKHGTDIDCGNVSYKKLAQAVKENKITEAELDVSLKRLFMIRFRLGMFDPPTMVKYASTSEDVLESAAHQKHALDMARQSIVLLKNDPLAGTTNGFLPLDKTKVKKIAVLGPNADNPIAILGNYNGNPSFVTTALRGITNVLGSDVQVIYEKAINFTNDTLLTYTGLNSQFSWGNQNGFRADYFSNKELKGEPVVSRLEPDLDNSWMEKIPVVDSILAYNFSARYTSQFKSPKTGEVVFEIEGDDGYKFFINDNELINAWQRNRWGARLYKLNAEKDSVYKIVVEYWQGEGKAKVKLRTAEYVKTDINKLAAKLSDVDAIIYVGGISPQLEGEEMRVDFPGFHGGDRTTIQLPAIQTELMKALHATGKPVVFVIMTGSAIATPWESENIPSIINAWYGGQSAGTAIADVLFGDYNPGGRLPVTFYKSDTDLPAFSSYDMTNRTYRYFKGEALYPFGYGLSYTQFTYDRLVIPASIRAGLGVLVSVRVTNTGRRDGDEVVQLYVANQNNLTRAPIRALKGFKRIFLKAGESRILQFKLSSADISIVNETGNLTPIRGTIMISAGGGQPGMKIKTSSNVISKLLLIK